MDRTLEAIALSCVVECERQHVGLDRLACLISGYSYAVDNAGRLPTEGDLLHLAGVIEPMNNGRYRSTPVTFASGGFAASAQSIPGATARMFGYLDEDTDPDEFTRSLLRIHPFTDGNGRVAFVIRNWLAGTLLEPSALPDYEF